MWRAVLVSWLAAGCSFDTSARPSDGDAADGVAAADGADSGTDAAVPSVAPPIAYWSFDLDGRDALGAHHGTLVGMASVTTGGAGVRGEALRLTGAGGRVDVGDPTRFNFNTDFTWHVYIRTAATAGALFARNPAGTAWNQGSKAIFVRASTVQWDTGWVSNPQTSARVDDNSWHQVIVTYVADTDSLDVFVDPAQGAMTGPFSGAHDVNRYDEHTHLHLAGRAETGFSIGSANFSGGLASLETLIGVIDEAAVFDRALRGAELDLLIERGPVAFVP